MKTIYKLKGNGIHANLFFFVPMRDTPLKTWVQNEMKWNEWKIESINDQLNSHLLQWIAWIPISFELNEVK